MKYFKTSKETALFIYCLVFLMTSIIAGLLCIQYQALKEEVQDLIEIKDAYYQHVDMLKRSLNASLDGCKESFQEEDQKHSNVETTVEKDEQQEGQKKSDNIDSKSDESPFQLISREEEDQLDTLKRRIKNFEKKAVEKVEQKLQRSNQKIVKNSLKSNMATRDIVFSWPIELSRFWLSSLFGPRKQNGKISFHYAIDMASLKGTPVKASAEGKVVLASYISGYGNCVLIEHNNRYKTRYAHLDTIKVKVGQTVKNQDSIGTVGDTGLVRSSGKDASHLHFEIYQDGKRVNPLKFLFT